jgi:hypothetical protein
MALAKNSGVQHVMMLTNPADHFDVGKLDQNVLVPGTSN